MQQYEKHITAYTVYTYTFISLLMCLLAEQTYSGASFFLVRVQRYYLLNCGVLLVSKLNAVSTSFWYHYHLSILVLINSFPGKWMSLDVSPVKILIWTTSSLLHTRNKSLVSCCFYSRHLSGILFLQLLTKSEEGGKVEIEELMTYSLTPVPYSLAMADGFLNKTMNPRGFHYFINEVENSPMPSSKYTLKIEDENAVFFARSS